MRSVNIRRDPGHSSIFVSPVFIAASFALGLLSAFFGRGLLSAVLFFFSFFSLAANILAKSRAGNIHARSEAPTFALFPDEELETGISIRNEGSLSYADLRIILPLSSGLCLVPENSRVPEEWEIAELSAGGHSGALIGDVHTACPKPHSGYSLKIRWTGKCRGFFDASGWTLLAGDPAGLCMFKRDLWEGAAPVFYVFPRLVFVRTDIFTAYMWKGEGGRSGITEDPSLIKTSRSYTEADPAKNINWRLAARGLPLTVNVYEKLSPGSIHFILDGESFSGVSGGREMLEDAISLTASSCAALTKKGIYCGISLPEGKGRAALTLAKSADVMPILYRLSEYEPIPQKAGCAEKRSVSRFAFDEIQSLESSVSRFFYVTRSFFDFAENEAGRRLSTSSVTVLAMERDDGRAVYFPELCHEH